MKRHFLHPRSGCFTCFNSGWYHHYMIAWKQSTPDNHVVSKWESTPNPEPQVYGQTRNIYTQTMIEVTDKLTGKKKRVVEKQYRWPGGRIRNSQQATLMVVKLCDPKGWADIMKEMRAQSAVEIAQDFLATADIMQTALDTQNTQNTQENSENIVSNS